MKRILLLSNMFPHAGNVASGVFVEKMMYQLIDDEQLNVDLCVLRPQRYKLVAYLSFYLRAFWSMLVGRN